MNNVSLIGRLTKDVDLRYTGNQTAVAGFTIAVKRDFVQEGQPEADFLPVVVWSKTAEFCSKHFAKGQQVGVTGRIQTRTWDDTDGNKHYVTEIVAEKVFFADSKKDNANGAPPQDPPPQENPSLQQAKSQKPSETPTNQQQNKSNPPWMR